jgi:hypothetical protein
MKVNRWIALALLCTLSGCVRTEYDILVEPAGEDLYRQITIDRVGLITTSVESEDGQAAELQWETADPGKAEVGRIAQLYDTATPLLQRKKKGPLGETKESVTFGKKFNSKTPNDVGGAGFYARIKTNLGTCHLYMERIRGCDDQASILQNAFEQADKATDRLRDWLKAQLLNDADLPRLLQFLDNEWRNDAKNLTLAAWTSRNTPRLLGSAAGQAGQTVATEATARVLAYLIERRYLHASDLPTLYRALNDDRPEEVIKPLVSRMLTEKVGVKSKEIHDLFAAAAGNPTAAMMSIQHWNDPDSPFHPWARSWRQTPRPPEGQNSADQRKFRRGGAIMLWRMFFTGRSQLLELLNPPNKMTFRLRTGTQPLHTSGQWMRKKGLVTWSDLLDSEHLPMLCHALWCKENEEFQTAHFGRVILTGQALVEYCVWRKSLTPKEADKWDGFLGSCKPGRKLSQRIKRFGFLPREATGANKPSKNNYAQIGVNILLQAMDPAR